MLRTLRSARRALRVGFLAGVALTAASASAGSTAREGGTFRIGIQTVLTGSLDPALVEQIGTTQLVNATCGALVQLPDKPLSAGLRLVPDVAADYPVVSRGGKTYTFTIRPGLRFSTGAPVTARDFVASINRILNPALKAPATDLLLGIVGARRVLDGRATTASGVTARRGKLIVRLTKPDSSFPDTLSYLCVLPANLAEASTNPEGLRAPIPSAGPYYVSEYVPGERVVLERNRFYNGRRPHHVNRFLVTVQVDPEALLDQVERGDLDYAFVANAAIASRARNLVKKYGRNKERFWVQPGAFVRMFVINTSRPLFRNNPKLRQAVNFAVDRTALLRERGGKPAGTLTDQYLTPLKFGFRDEPVYPLKRPDLARAKALARGRTRSGKAVLYASGPGPVAQGQIIAANLKQIGLQVEVRDLGPVLFDKLASPGEPFDIGYIGWLSTSPDPGPFLEALFGGRLLGHPDNINYSYFNSVKYNQLLDRASQLTGEARYRAYGGLDVRISRDAAPAIPYAYDNTLTLVGPRTGCVVVNPYLDLSAVCLK